jgi:hypothetical protein
MKLTSTILFLGLGMSATVASEEANLRANASSRHLASYSNQKSSGATWMFYLMLNTLSAPIDLMGFACGSSECYNSTSSSSSSSSSESWGTDGYSTTTTSTASWTNDAHTSTSSWTNDGHTSSNSTCPERCHKAPHLHPPHPPKPKPKPKPKTITTTTTSTTWATDGHEEKWTDDGHHGDEEESWGDDGNGDKSGYNNDANSDGVENGGAVANNDNGNGNSGYDDANKNQYLSSNSNGSGNASQIKGAKSMPVWPFLVAALAVGVVAAALMAKKRKKARQGKKALKRSIKSRMELFSGGLHRKEKPAAASPLYENDYQNEPPVVEMRRSW